MTKVQHGFQCFCYCFSKCSSLVEFIFEKMSINFVKDNPKRLINKNVHCFFVLMVCFLVNLESKILEYQCNFKLIIFFLITIVE